MDRDSIFPHHIERTVVRHRYLEPENPDAAFCVESSKRTSELPFDGRSETVIENNHIRARCGHFVMAGASVAFCEACSEEAGRPMYVCGRCSINCPVTGQLLCLRHTQLGPDGKRYSPEGYRQAERLGWFTRAAAPAPSAPDRSGAAICAPSRTRGFFRRLLEWW